VHRELIDEVRRTASIGAILDIAYQLEEEAFAMFDAQAAKAESDEGRKIFRELAKFEQGHMRKIDEMRQQYA
jgi:rubrerythrin